MTRKRPSRRAEASRRNGAASNGPTSQEGKAAASQNARKHGLFAALPADQVAASNWPARLAAMLDDSAAPFGLPDSDLPVEAALRLEQVTAFVDRLASELRDALATGKPEAKKQADLIEQLARMRTYQRRFRGRRDRALRKLAARDRRARNARTRI